MPSHRLIRTLLAAALALGPLNAPGAPVLPADLPVMQYHSGSTGILYANVIRTSSILVRIDPALLTPADIDANGWIKRFHASNDNIWYTLPSAEQLHGVYVVTWDGSGDIQFKTPGNFEEVLLNDPVNRRIVARNPEGVGARIEVRSMDPVDYIRNIKVWAPAHPGAGADLTPASNLAVGQIGGNLEPAPGEPEPLFHPLRLAMMAEGEAGVIRFMSFLGNINVPPDIRKPSPDWSGRAPADYGYFSDGQVTKDFITKAKLTDYGHKSLLGLPYEHLVELCNILGRDLWIQVPHDVDEAFARSLASLVAANLDPSLRVWAEYSNELWNGASSYLAQLTHARQAYADAFGIPLAEVDNLGPEHAWGTAKVSTDFLAAFADQWISVEGLPDARCINVLSGWQNGATYNQNVHASAEALHPGLSEVFAITTYFGNSLAGNLVGLDYDDAGNAAEETYREAAKIVQSDIYNNIQGRWVNAAASLPLPVVAYEGGQHLTPTGYINANPGFSPFLANLNRHPLMGELYTTHWHLWRASGCVTPSLFTEMGAYGTYGYWGAKESLFDTAETHSKWKAYVEYTTAEAGVRPVLAPLGTVPSVVTGSLPDGEAGVAYAQAVASTGGDGAVLTQHVGGLLPLGMQATANPDGSVTLSGTPTESGVFPLTFRALDADLDPGYTTLALSIGPAGMTNNNLIDFKQADIPVVVSSSRDPQTLEAGLRLFWPFGLDNASGFFTDPLIPAGSDLQFYGGYNVTTYTIPDVPLDDTPPYIDPQLDPTRGFKAYHAGTADLASEDTALFVWRKDQFNHFAGETVRFGGTADTATLLFETNGLPSNGTEIRFAILNGSTWYVSEAVFTGATNGQLYLDAFNNNTATGKRWAVFTPTANAFDLPDPLPAFGAVDFDDVQAVGVHIWGYHNRYGWTLGFKRFLAIGAGEASGPDYGTWSLAIPDPAWRDPALDYDADGRLNLMEYALGADPTAADAAHDPALGVDGTRLTLRFFRDPARSDIRYTVEAGHDLATWSDLIYDSAAPAPGYAVNNDGTHMIVTDVQDLSGPRFLRLRVELVP
ncbi:MAG: hypothetical protein ACP5I4_05505 [Oceanipulchritudo sp.]